MAIPSEVKEHFIEFGNILNKEERTHLVDCLEAAVDQRLSGTWAGSSNFEHCRKSIEEIFSDESFKQCCLQNPSVATQVSVHILKALEYAKRASMVSSPYGEEDGKLEQCRKLETDDFINEAISYFDLIERYYQKADLNVGFYRQVLEDKEALANEPMRAAALKESFQNEWSARLNDKQLRWEMEQIDNMREELCKELYSKAENFEKMKEALLPFNDFMETGRLWDMSAGIWRKTDFNVLTSYSQYLQKEKEIRELAEMLGRLREAEDETIEIEIKQTVVVQGWTTEHASKAELVGVHESDDLSALLPSEVALLSEELTESIFFKKFAEKKLLTFDYMERVSQQKTVEISTKQTMKKPKDKGPIIVCIDTSGSMEGTPERVAKLMCFALLQIAIRDRRKCYLVSYSSSVATLDISDMNNSIPRLVDFLGMSFHGGNNEEVAFAEILSQLGKGDYSNADVVFISDFITQGLSEKTKSEILKSKSEKKTMFHSLIISSVANPDILGIFDNNWLYNMNSDKAIVNMAKDIRGFKKGAPR
jgi:uncharacterized protein with von Willebrand factor type A (vWA) domain